MNLTFPAIAAAALWYAASGPAAPPHALHVTDFLPADYVTDGSVSYQASLQEAIDTAATQKKTLVFRPMVYLLTAPAGLELRSGSTLDLRGAVFRLAEECREDGQAFVGRDVTDVTLLGGEVAGCRDAWPDSVNDAGLSEAKVEERYGKLRADFRRIGAEWIILTPHYIRPSWMGLTSQRNIDDDPRPYVKAVRRFATKNGVAVAEGALRYGRLVAAGHPPHDLDGKQHQPSQRLRPHALCRQPHGAFSKA